MKRAIKFLVLRAWLAISFAIHLIVFPILVVVFWASFEEFTLWDACCDAWATIVTRHREELLG